MTIVTDYIDRLGEAEKPVLNHLREVVYQLVPDAEDAFSYGVPTYRYKGRYLLAFASNKKFMSIYPGAEVIEILKSDLKNYPLSKGTISFTPDNPLTDDLLKKVILLSKGAIEHRYTK
jgi:uncharacterized protein YdhG (YjbR/CyaY superfamily)